MSFLEKKRAITDLGNYLQNNLFSLRVQDVKVKLSKIRQVFGAQSHTGKLAIHIMVIIQTHESADSLDEFSLICFCMMILYERYFDSLALKRQIIEARDLGRLSRRVSQLSRPSRRHA